MHKTPEKDLAELLKWLITFDRETEWLEFKVNNGEPHEIGEYISALSNSACIHEKEKGYLVFGVKDKSPTIVGTDVKPSIMKKGNEDFEPWLNRLLNPRIEFIIHEFSYEGKNITLFEIQPTHYGPVKFNGKEWIRIGTHNKSLSDYPEKEKKLWQIASRYSFEKEIAKQGCSSDDVLKLLDYTNYFKLTEQRLPDNRKGILEKLCEEHIIIQRGNDRFDIANLGALLFATNLKDFSPLDRKAPRVVIYKDNTRNNILRQQQKLEGYALSFKALIDIINASLPENEHIGKALRTKEKLYPEIAIREFVANALIHQDLTVRNEGPKIEIFSDRIEISNPGKPLIDTDRFIDARPKARNADLGQLMYRMGMCEQLGSGVKRALSAIELFQLPAPDFKTAHEHTIVTMYAHKILNEMNQDDRIRICYQHAVLRYVNNQEMTNASLRERLSIEDKNSSIASRLIRETSNAGKIKRSDPESNTRKHVKYVPYWARNLI